MIPDTALRLLTEFQEGVNESPDPGGLRPHGTAGANRETIDIPNVLFLGPKVEAIQRMIAVKPDEFSHVVLK
jgi:hypothetical protein